MKYTFIALLLFLLTAKTASEIPNVKVEQIDIEERDTPYGERNFITLLVRNDTNRTIKVLETRVCYARRDCEKGYLTGRFIPGAASWSNEATELGGRVISVTLVRIQTVED